MKIRVSNSLFVILVSAVLWQPVSAAADSYDPPARVARLSYSRGSVSFQPAGDSEWVDAVLNLPIVTGDNLWARCFFTQTSTLPPRSLHGRHWEPAHISFRMQR